jgi:hypothetical protein
MVLAEGNAEVVRSLGDCELNLECTYGCSISKMDSSLSYILVVRCGCCTNRAIIQRSMVYKAMRGWVIAVHRQGYANANGLSAFSG